MDNSKLNFDHRRNLEFLSTLKQNLEFILNQFIKNNRFCIKYLPDHLRLGQYHLDEFKGDKSKNESKIYFDKSKDIVFKVRITNKKIDFNQLIEFLNNIEKDQFNLDKNTYEVLKLSSILNVIRFNDQNIKNKIQRILKTKEIYFIVTNNRGKSLKNFKEEFLNNKKNLKSTKIKITKIIILKLILLLIVLNEGQIFLCDMVIRNFGIYNTDLSILDEEMIHVGNKENSKENLRRRKLSDLFYVLCREIFECVLLETAEFKEILIYKLKNYFKNDTKKNGKSLKTFVELQLKILNKKRKRDDDEEGREKKKRRIAEVSFKMNEDERKSYCNYIYNNLDESSKINILSNEIGNLDLDSKSNILSNSLDGCNLFEKKTVFDDLLDIMYEKTKI